MPWPPVFLRVRVCVVKPAFPFVCISVRVWDHEGCWPSDASVVGSAAVTLSQVFASARVTSALKVKQETANSLKA